MFLWKYKEKQFFCGCSILSEGVFLIQLSSDAGISVWQIFVGYDIFVSVMIR
jgi:hypothetical protein